MKLALISLISILSLLARGQNHVLYETGRPASLEYNNAKRVTGHNWCIDWLYADDEVIEKMSHEKIGRHNDSIMALISKKKGAEWQRDFYSQVDQELALQNELRNKIREKESYKMAAEKVFEPHILFEKNGNKKKSKYTAHIVGQLKTDEERKFKTLCKFKLAPKKAIPDFNCEEQTLSISFPQNGVQ